MDSADSIIQVSHAFRLLFQDELLNARALLLEKQSVQPYNHLGLSIIIFVEALLGMEEHVISNALEALLKSEQAIKNAKNSLNSSPTSISNSSTNHWWSPGLEYDIMLADVLIFQSILHFMAETISDSMKGIYKLTKAYKIYSSSHQAIFSELEKQTTDEPVSASGQNQKPSTDDLHGEIDELIDTIQEFYSKPKKQPAASSSNASTSYLASSLNFLSGFGSRKKIAHSSEQSTHVDVSPPTYKNWTDDPIASLVIGGSTFGFGLFGLILSFLPPKVIKLLSWVGLNNNNTAKSSVDSKTNQNLAQRNQSIKWLLFSNSSCHWELHAKLAGLGLITYRSVMLKVVGWLAAPERVIKEYENLLNSLADNKEKSKLEQQDQNNTQEHEEQGTIWTIHKSRLLILQGDIQSSKKIIVGKLEQIQKIDQNPTQAQTPPKSVHSIGLLIYELALISVRLADWLNAGEAFLSLKQHNAWSHVTYQFAALGCFLSITDKSKELQEKIDHLFEELPSLFSKKKSMGREMPPHEMLVNRKLNEYKSKHADLGSKGFITPERKNCYWDSIQISPIEELSLMMMIYDDSPKRRLILGIRRLSSLKPTVSVDLSKISDGAPHEDVDHSDNQEPVEESLINLKLKATDDDPKTVQPIDMSLSREEVIMRDLLLGVQLMNLGEYDQSRVFLNKVPNPNPSPQQQQQQQQQQPAENSKEETEEKRDRKGDYNNYVNALIYKSLIELKELDHILSKSSTSPKSHQQVDQLTPTRSSKDLSGIHPPDGKLGISNDTIQLCLSKLRTADSILDSILELQESYHMRSRTESKIQLLKEQIQEKILKLSQ